MTYLSQIPEKENPGASFTSDGDILYAMGTVNSLLIL